MVAPGRVREREQAQGGLLYGKLFADVFSSSILEEPLHVRYLWMSMIALADEEGVVDMTVGALARRVNLSPDETGRAIEILAAPDPESRTPDKDGRRIEQIREHTTWGWRLVNHARYRSMGRNQDRKDYQRGRRRPKQDDAIALLERLFCQGTNGAIPAVRCFELASAEGIDEHTIKAAKVEVGVQSVRRNNSWYWELQGAHQGTQRGPTDPPIPETSTETTTDTDTREETEAKASVSRRGTEVPTTESVCSECGWTGAKTKAGLNRHRGSEKCRRLSVKGDPEQVDAVWAEYLEIVAPPGSPKLTKARRQMITSRLGDSTREEIRAAFEALVRSDWHRERGFTDIGYALRTREKLEKAIAWRHGQANETKEERNDRVYGAIFGPKADG